MLLHPIVIDCVLTSLEKHCNLSPIPTVPLELQEDAPFSGAAGAPHGPGGGDRERVRPGTRRLPAAHLRGSVRGQCERGHPAAGLPHH